MAYFAQLDENNVVLQVLALDNSLLLDAEGQEQEELGVQFLKNLLGQETTWKQTSYNTHANEHLLGGVSFRKNYAGIGYVFNAQLDAFIPPKPELQPEEEQYVYLDEEKGLWVDTRIEEQQEPQNEIQPIGVTRV